MTINDTYNAAGGGLLASGLAFSALFAIIPALLMIVSLLVIAVDDPARRQEVIDWIVTQVPPLSEVAGNQVVTNLAEGARVGSIVGFLGFLWGASGFYLALDGALARFFPARRGRDPIRGASEASQRWPCGSLVCSERSSRVRSLPAGTGGAAADRRPAADPVTGRGDHRVRGHLSCVLPARTGRPSLGPLRGSTRLDRGHLHRTVDLVVRRVLGGFPVGGRSDWEPSLPCSWR